MLHEYIARCMTNEEDFVTVICNANNPAEALNYIDEYRKNQTRLFCHELKRGRQIHAGSEIGVTDIYNSNLYEVLSIVSEFDEEIIIRSLKRYLDKRMYEDYKNNKSQCYIGESSRLMYMALFPD